MSDSHTQKALDQLAAWRGVITQFHDPFWVADQHITENKSPRQIYEETSVTEWVIVGMLEELGLWAGPHWEPFPQEEWECEDLPKVERFLSWFLLEQHLEKKYIVKVHQHKNDITLTCRAMLTHQDGTTEELNKTFSCNAFFDYIKSTRWLRKSARLKLEKGGCEFCGSTDELCCHHLTYKHLGDELDEDLQILCGECHKRIHQR